MSVSMRLPIAAVLVAFALNALGTELSFPLLTFFTSDNLGLDYATQGGSWNFGIYGGVGALVGILSSSSLDRLPSLRTAIGGLLVSAVVHTAVSLIVPLLSQANGAYVFTVGICMIGSGAHAIAGPALALSLHRLLNEYYMGESKRVTDAGRKWFFSMVYCLFNLMAAVADILYDVLRTETPSLTPAQANNISLLLAGASQFMAAAIIAIVAWKCVKAADRAHVTGDVRLGAAPVSTICCGPQRGRFWRFMALCTALLGTRSLFRHMDSSLGIFMSRAIGPSAHFALVQSVNPIMVVLCVWWLPSLVYGARFSSYTLFTLGTTLSALAPTLIGLAFWAGVFPLTASAITWQLVGMVVLFTLGEMSWSPYIANYALTVAPKGNEAVYNALAALPSLMVTLPTSALSAALVEAYCPSGGDCMGAPLWATIGLIALSTPLILLLTERWLREKEIDSEGL